MTANTARLTQRRLLAAAALALCVIVATAVWGLATSGAWAAADDGSATTTAEIVLVVAGDEPANPVTPAPGYTRGSSPSTGDPLTWAPFALLAAAALAVGSFAYRRSGAVRSAAAAHSAGPSSAPAKRRVRSSAAMHAAPTPRTQANASKPHVREFDMPAHRRIFSAILVVVLVAGLAPTVPVQWAHAAEGAEDSSQIRIELADADDGTLSGTATYNVPNDATYYRELVKLTEESVAGYNLADGSITITVAPASDPADAIASPDAVKGATTSGGDTWLVPGSAVTDDATLALKITATATGLKAGEHKVGTMKCDLQALEYTDLQVRLSASPAVGKPLTATVSGAPTEAENQFTFTWLASDDGQTWEPVTGATGAMFTPTADLAGKRIGVKVECANAAWFVVSPDDFGTVAAAVPAPTAGQHVVVFDVGEHGDAPAAQLVNDGEYAEKPADPSEGSFKFGGWYADAELTQPFTFSATPITQDITLYAAWDRDPVGTYTVVHMLQRLEDEAGYDEAARDVKTGEFTGNIADIARSYTGFIAARYEADDASAGEHVLNLYYDRNKYTVTFHADGAEYATEQVRYGASAEKPATDPTSTGKDFAHWTTAQDGDGTAYDFTTPITGDLDLYACFATQTLTVTFETWGQEPKPAIQRVEYGSTASEPSSPTVGQGDPEFRRWCADSALTIAFDFSKPIQENTTVYAEYAPNVLFDLDGKAENVSLPVKQGGNVALDTADPYTTKATTGTSTATIKPTGYKIEGWYTDRSYSVPAGATLNNITDSKTLYAKLSPITYKVAFDANTGTGSMGAQTIAYDANTALDKSTFTKAGYDFAGWNTQSDGSGTTYADEAQVKNLCDTQDAEITLYAQWTPSANTQYSVKHYYQNLDNDEYTLGETETLRGTTGGQTAAAAKMVTGFTAKSFDQATISAAGDTAVAIYYNRSTYTVTYRANGHGEDPNAASGIRHGATLASMPTPEATGYTFDGWYKDAGCTTAWTQGSDAVTSDTTLYAKWEGKPYTISFNANSDPEGSTETMSAITTKVGESVTLPNNAFTRQGWTFAGWNTAADDSGTSYANGATASDFSTDGSNVTLHAQWTGNSGINYTVKHLKETGLNTGEYSVDAGTETLTGVAGEETAASAKEIDGYTALSFSQKTISGKGDTVVEIHYSLGSHTVTFQTWGQDTVESQVVAHGGHATDPNLSTSGTPAFVGWFTDASLTNQVTDFSSIAIEKDTTFYAKYTPNVLVDFQGRATNASIGAVLNQPFEASKLNGVSAPGYDILGYYTDAECNNVQEFPFTPTGDTTLYAKLQARDDTRYKVEHYQQSLNDESEYQLVETDSLQGTTATDTNAQAKSYSGFSCAGTDKAGSGSIAQQPIAGDGSTVIKLYYTRNTVNYTVKHWQQNLTGSAKPADYTEVIDDRQTLSGKTGATTAAVAKNYTGFTADAVSQEEIAGDGNTEVNIYYTRNTYTVTFDNQSYGIAPSAQTVRYGGKASEPAALSDTVYDFGGWYTEAACTNQYNFNSEVTASRTLYAKWTKKKFTVSFVVEQARAITPASQEVEYGERADKPDAAAKDGFGFVGWYKESTYKTLFDFAAEVITQATSIYGRYEQVYTVNYNENGGDAASVPQLQTKIGTVDLTLSATTPTRSSESVTRTVTFNANGGTSTGAAGDKLTLTVTTDYEFSKWNTKSDASGTDYESGGTYSNDASAVLYAQWNPRSTTPQGEITLPTPTLSGYVFAGWWTESSGGAWAGKAGDSYTPSADETLYAHWSPAVIHYAASGSASGTSIYVGTGKMADQDVNPTQAFVIDACTFTAPDESMGLIGWNTKEDGSGRWVMPGEGIAANDGLVNAGEEITLYAQWSHFAGKTAADLSAISYSGDYLGDLWVSDKLDVIPDGATREADQVMICRLIGTEPDNSNLLTFMVVRGLPTNHLYHQANVNVSGWPDSMLHAALNDSSTGAVYQMLPSTLKSRVVAVDKKVYPNTTVKDMFWLISQKELLGTSSYDEGDQYSYFAHVGDASAVNAWLTQMRMALTNSLADKWNNSWSGWWTRTQQNYPGQQASGYYEPYRGIDYYWMYRELSVLPCFCL